MWSIAVCDDDRRVCYDMEEILDVYGMERKWAMEIDLFHDGAQLYKKMIGGKKYDMIFLDILMLEMDGIETGRKIRRKLEDEDVQIIYMSYQTGHADMLLQNRPFGFIKKPVKEQEVAGILEYEYRLSAKYSRCFFYQKGRLIHRVPYESIVYFQSAGRKVEIHTTVQVYEFNGKLSGILGEGLPDNFLQIHKSYIVNRDYVERVGRERIYLKNNDTYLPVSYPYRTRSGICLTNFVS